MRPRPGEAAPTTPTRAPIPGPPPTADRLQALEKRNRALTIAVAVLGVIVIVLGLMAFLPGSSPIPTPVTRTVTEANAEEDVEEITANFSEAIASYDYRQVRETLDRAQQYTTAGFSENFQPALRGDLSVFRQRIINTQAVATADVKGVALQTLEEDTATTLMFAVQTIRTRENPRSETRFLVVETALVKEPSGWKVDSFRLPSGVDAETAS